MKQRLLSILIVFFAIILSCGSTHAQNITTMAGNGTAGYSGNGGQATAAKMSVPVGVSFDQSGNFYFVDYANNVIRKINSSGVISTVVGNGTSGFSGDGAAATAAEINGPQNIAFDTHGNMYIPDANNARIRKVNTSGIITTVAGNGTPGFSGDGGAATAAKLNQPLWVAVDKIGNLYIEDQDNNRVRKVDTNGIITTIAGNGSFASPGTGNNGPATAAKFSLIEAVTVDGSGNVYVSDNNQIRKIGITDTITLVAGTGTGGYSGDSGPATAAKINAPFGLTFDASGNLYIADEGNNRIRKVNTSGVITTVAGNGTAGFSGDGGPAIAAKLNQGIDVRFDTAGNLYISDINNNRIRKVTGLSVAAITGNTTVLVDSTDTLYDATPGGVWSSSSPTTANIDSSTGILTGITEGIDTITYTVGTQSFDISVIVEKTTGTHDPPDIDQQVPPIYDSCKDPVVHIPGTLSICPEFSASIMDTLGLPLGFTILHYNWTPGTGVSPVSGVDPTTTTFLAPSVPTLQTLTVWGEGPNLIQNGQFILPSSPTCANQYTDMESYYDCDLTGGNGDHWGYIKIGNSGCDNNSDGMYSLNADACGTWSGHTGTYPNVGLVVRGTHAPFFDTFTAYFWGQKVMLCPGGKYVFIYWFRNLDPTVDNDSVNSPYFVPEILSYVGNSGGLHTLEYGDITSGDGSTLLKDTLVGYYPGCDTGWHEIRDTFYASSSQSYMALFVGHSAGETFMIDDISLNRLTIDSGAILVEPYPPPVETITSAVPTTTPCVGTIVSFHISGNVGDVLHYKVISPQTGTTYGTQTLTASVWLYNLTSTVAGTASFTIDSVTEASPAGCTFATTASMSITFEPLPAITLSSATICQGTTIALIPFTITGGSPATYSLTWGGSASGVFSNVSASTTWPGSSPLNVAIPSGASAGNDTATLTIKSAYGCTSSYTIIVTINPNPKPITPNGDSVCIGGTLQLNDPTAGGTWSVLPPLDVSVNSSGLVTGDTSGPTTVKYTLSTGCYATAHVYVDPSPTITIFPISVCKGTTKGLLLYGVDGGTTFNVTWSPGAISAGFTNVSLSNPPPSTPDSISIPPTANPGTYTGTLHMQTISTGCEDSETFTVVIKSLPGVISPTQVCLNQSVTLTDTPSLGTWSSIPGSGSLSVSATSGVAAGTSVGAAKAIYTAPDGCKDTATITIHPLPSPGTIISINGLNINDTDHFCSGSTDTLYDAQPHGSWMSSNTGSIVIINTNDSPAVCIVHAVGAGIALITYTDSNVYGCTARTSAPFKVDTSGIAPINGVLGVCQGYTTPLGDITPGGTWHSSDSAIASINATTGVVNGIMPGIVTITYQVINACGTYTTTSTLVVDMPPYITTNSTVACQTLDNGIKAYGATSILNDSDGCIKVCERSVVRYYANGNYGSAFTWTESGGTVIHNYGDNIDIEWTAAGIPAQISLFDSLGSCNGAQTVCIDIIKRPSASFAVLPSTIKPTGLITICDGSTVSFMDLSTADPTSPIISWFWDFGDGYTSAQENPTHTFSTVGTYTVSLVVKNACNCSDTFTASIKVILNPAPQIACTSVECQNSTATYSTGTGCGSYTWTVNGGTIISGSGTATISVSWDSVNQTTGLGYVSVVSSCSGCPDPGTIQVPVIPLNPVIQGPDTICEGQQYLYTLPLSPGTQYSWGLLGDPLGLPGAKDDYKVIVQPNSTGSFTLHGWFQNSIMLCGGNVTKQIVVVPPATITGDLTPCYGSATTYTIVGGDSGVYTWVLTGPNSGTNIGSDSGSTFTPSFWMPGEYHLSISGHYCTTPITINVGAVPPALNGITGPDTVCLNRVYTYIAYTDSPSSVYNWTIMGGTITPGVGKIVNVVWTSSGTKTLTAYRSSVSAPFCPGPSYTINVVQELINPNITGDTLPCANGYRTYTANYTRGETYLWSISPSSAGSIVGGQYTPTVNVLWNNTATITNATLTSVISKCDSTFTKTRLVHVQPSPIPVISGPSSPICPGDTVVFTASAGATSYIWNFGDGTQVTVPYYNVVSHVFPINESSSNEAYTVKVTLTADTTLYCPITGTAVMQVLVKPGPIAFASAPTDNLYTWPIQIVATVTNNVSGLSYMWYDDGTLIGGATQPTYTATDSGSYSFLVTAGNGCSAMSNEVVLYMPPNANPGLCDTLGLITLSDSSSCNTIYLKGTGPYSSPTWIAAIPPAGGLVVTGTYTAQATYNTPGIYEFIFSEIIDTCKVQKNIFDTIGFVPAFTYVVNCSGTAGTDSLKLMDHTAYLPNFFIDSISWHHGGTYLGSGNDLNLGLAAPASYDVTETVYATGPQGIKSCQVTQTIILPALPSVSFTDSISPICEGVPIYFTPTTSAGIVGYYWSFGDSATSLLQSPQRTYTWGPPNATQTRFVNLTVTDNIGCTASSTDTVFIHHNLISGNIGPTNQVVCANEDSNIILAFDNTGPTSPVSYQWSNTSTASTINVYESGAYWVTLEDVYQCQATIPLSPAPPVHINFIHTPAAVISGQQTYCTGDVVTLSGYAGVGAGITYQWLRDSVTVDGNTPSISDESLPVGTYYYQLIITTTDSLTSISCPDTSAIYPVHIYGLPQAPYVTGPNVIDCQSYHLQLVASAPESGTYNWSDGTYGATDNIYAGGPYQVWFTNQYGCTSDTQVYVQQSPSYYFQYFPSGCYDICSGLLPFTLDGPPVDTFVNWQWDTTGTVLEQGEGLMSPYTVHFSGGYYWSLNNGLCTQQSPKLELATDTTCSDCSKYITVNGFACQPTNPASFSLSVVINNPTANTAYAISTNEGPVIPFIGFMSSTGFYTLTLTFTTLAVPAPSSVAVETQLQFSDGTKCSSKSTVSVPDCTWAAERTDSTYNGTIDSVVTGDGNNGQIILSSALLVYPNPSSGDVNMNYDFGGGSYKERMLGIYNALGQRMAYTVAEQKGAWTVNTSGWADGTYVIRMEADGSNLQIQKFVVSH